MTHRNNLTFPFTSVAASLARRTWLLLAFTAAVISPAPTVAGQPDGAIQSTAGIRPQDQLWLVSTRHIGCSNCGGSPAFWQLSGGQWTDSSAEEFHRTGNPAQTTVIYIHGNRIDDQQ